MNPQSNRPLSPHLQIYRPQITSIMSIMHRGTGIFFILGIMGIMVWVITLASGVIAFSFYQNILRTIPGEIFLISLSFSLFYHLANGIRHLLWDFGWGYKINQVYLTSWIVVSTACLLTVILWVRLTLY